MAIRDYSESQPSMGASVSTRWELKDEIDLREYIHVLVRWWREIVAVTLVTIVVTTSGVWLYNVWTVPMYGASSTVAIARVKSDITFDDRYRTLSEDSLQALSGNSTRRMALLSLVTTNAVAVSVIEQMGDKLDVEQRNPTTLLEDVTATMLQPSGNNVDSDLINIEVQAETPAQAALIANLWAQTYVLHVNDLYGSVPQDLLGAVENELKKSEGEYLVAQKALETFISRNSSSQLERLIAEKTIIVETLKAGREMAVSLYINKELTAQEEMETLYAERQRLQLLLTHVQDLAGQIAQGGDAAAGSSGLAILLLKGQIFGKLDSLPSNLQLTIDSSLGQNLTAARAQVDLQALTGVLQERLLVLDQQLATYTGRLIAGGNFQLLDVPTSGASSESTLAEVLPTSSLEASALLDSSNALNELILQTEMEIQTLRSQLEAETANLSQLTLKRDLAKSTLQTLTNKAAEMKLQSTGASSEVRFASPAAAPVDPIETIDLGLAAGLAAVLGLMLSVFTVFLLNFMGSAPFITRQT